MDRLRFVIGNNLKAGFLQTEASQAEILNAGRNLASSFSAQGSEYADSDRARRASAEDPAKGGVRHALYYARPGARIRFKPLSTSTSVQRTDRSSPGPVVGGT